MSFNAIDLKLLPTPYPRCQTCNCNNIHFKRLPIMCERHKNEICKYDYYQGKCFKCKTIFDIQNDLREHIKNSQNEVICGSCEEQNKIDLEIRNNISKNREYVAKAIVMKRKYGEILHFNYNDFELSGIQCRCGHRRYIHNDSHEEYYASIYDNGCFLYKGNPHNSTIEKDFEEEVKKVTSEEIDEFIVKNNLRMEMENTTFIIHLK